MSWSLKEAGVTIAKVVGMPPATVYERQRLLFKAGMLEGSGRGPGSGVRATPESVATLLIALLTTTDSLGKTEDRTRTFSNLKATPSIVGIGRHHGRLTGKAMRKCPITGKATFGEALAAILAMDKLPKVIWLQVSPTRGVATITLPGGKELSEFTIDGKTAPTRITGMYVAVSLFEGLHPIADVLKGGEDAR